jgi:ribosome-binding protein aMBF1 (putative translation factor)
MTRKSKTDGLRILDRAFYDGRPARIAARDRAYLNRRIAEQIHDLRIRAGLSQRRLAALVGTTASVICRLEDADYRGHSLSMLHRIARALSSRVEVRFVPVRRKRRSLSRARREVA